MFNEILDKCKTHGDKRGLGYINIDESRGDKRYVLVDVDDFLR